MGKVRLSEKDIEILVFLARYKMMLGEDAKRIYNGKDYHRKRLKVLEREKYIKRVNRLCIKLDVKGAKLVRDFGYDYSFDCRKQQYIDRLNEIAKIAALTLNSNMEFVASWDLKDNNIFTQTSRKYLGKLTYQGKNVIVYYISKDKQIAYISQIINDIQKAIEYNNIMVFTENMKIISNYKRFVFGKASTVIVESTAHNLEIIRRLAEIDEYQIIKQIYENKEILLSNWKKANYMTEDKRYVFVMPFVDTERLYKLNMFFKSNQGISKKIDIITLKDNKEEINRILTNKVNIIEMDKWLGGIDE